jgi:hypothetical protein
LATANKHNKSKGVCNKELVTERFPWTESQDPISLRGEDLCFNDICI